MKILALTLALMGAAASCSCSSRNPSPSSSAFAKTSWSPQVKKIIAQNKAAMGGPAWNDVHSVHVASTATMGGLKGSMTKLVDLDNGREIAHFHLGPIKRVSGFDGKTSWRKLPNGTASIMTSNAAKKRSVNTVYKNKHALWFPERGTASVKLLATKTAHGKVFHVLKVTPKGGQSFELWINTKTHRVARSVSQSPIGQVATYMSYYRKVHGLEFPFHTKVILGKTGRTVTSTLKSVSVNVPVKPSDFAIPKSHKPEFSFVDGGHKATIPFKLIGNEIYIHVKVNGRPLHFIVDSGGMDVLTPKAAKALGLAGQGSLAMGGAGSGNVKNQVAKVKNLVLGGKVKLHDQLFTIVPLPKISRQIPVSGTVGYGMFNDLVVRIAYARGKLTFIQPKAFSPAQSAISVPITFVGQVPVIKGSIDGISGRFLLDTGSGFPLILMSPFSRTHHLYARYQATPAYAFARGYKGNADARITRAGKFRMGTVAVSNPVVALSTAKEGALSLTHVAGLIGGNIFKRFTMTMDYPQKRIYFKPNKNYGKPMHFNRTGISTRQTEDSLVVIGVMPGGPGAQAGIKAGDIITAVNGKPAAKLNPQTFRKQTRNDPPGAKMKFTLGQGKSAHQATITLRRLIPEKGRLKK